MDDFQYVSGIPDSTANQVIQLISFLFEYERLFAVVDRVVMEAVDVHVCEDTGTAVDVGAGELVEACTGWAALRKLHDGA